MSFYRSLLTAIVTVALASSVFAADKATAASTGAEAQKQSTAIQKINLNTSTAKELGHVKGLTFAKARSIVAYRNKNGNFKSLEDLKSVKALKKMDEKSLKEIQDQLTLS